MAVKLKDNGTKAGQPDLQVVKRKIADLKAYENNPRKNDSEVPKMVELIKEFGFKVPILVRGDRIVDGHLRIKAATALNMEEVPTIDVGDMPEAHEKALRIALNKSVEWAAWDKDALGLEMKAIADAGLSLNLTGFSIKEADDLVSKIANTAMTSEPPMKDPAGPKLTKNKDADAGTPADPNYVSVTFHMSAENRDVVMNQLNDYRGKQGYPNVSAALVGLVNAAVSGV